MEETKVEEYLSLSYMRALCAATGALYEEFKEDGDSKDLLLRKRIYKGTKGFWSSLYIQMKSTYSNSLYSETEESIKYALKIKNYNDLIEQNGDYSVLALLILPQDKEQWVTLTPENLILRRCVYWVNLQGKERSSNLEKVTVTIPKKNILNVDTLNLLFEKIAEGDEL